MPSYVAIYVVLIFLKAVGFPILKDVSWGWFIFWPVIALLLRVIIGILEFIIYPVIVFGFLWLMVKIYFFTF